MYDESQMLAFALWMEQHSWPWDNQALAYIAAAVVAQLQLFLCLLPVVWQLVAAYMFVGLWCTRGVQVW